MLLIIVVERVLVAGLKGKQAVTVGRSFPASRESHAQRQLHMRSKSNAFERLLLPLPLDFFGMIRLGLE